MDGKTRRTLIQGAADARYLAGGYLLYMKAGTLMSVGFDAERLEFTGSPVTMVDNVMQAIGTPTAPDETGAGQFDASSNGTLVCIEGGISPARKHDLVWVDRHGSASRLPLPANEYFAPRVSPNGERVVFFQRRGRFREVDMWVYDTSRQNMNRLTFQNSAFWASWSPDGRGLVFGQLVSGHLNLARVSADGAGTVEPLTSGERDEFPASWARSGNVVALLERRQGKDEIWMLPMDGDLRAKPFLQAPVSLSYPEFSPDGRWLAYVSPVHVPSQ